MIKGRVTIPTNLDVVPQTLEETLKGMGGRCNPGLRRNGVSGAISQV